MKTRNLLLATVFCMALCLQAQNEVQEIWVGQEYKCDLNSVLSDVTPFNISWDIDASIFSIRKDGSVCYISPRHYFSGTMALTCTFSFMLGGIPIEHEPVIWYFTCIDNPLSIEPAEMRLKVDQTGRIIYTHMNDDFTPFANVTFASDNQTVAVVSSDGTVKAMKEGSTRIAVHSNLAKDDQYCRVIVEGTAPVPVITLAEHQLEMDIDKTSIIDYIIEPAGSYTVTWSSSDESVATVTQSGKVKALKKGKATITAKIEDYDSSDACEVTVKAPRPTSIDIPDDSYSLLVGESLTIIPVVKPEDAEYTLSWKSSDPDVATVAQSGVVTAKNVGETRITVTIQGENRSDYCYVFVDKPTLTLKASLPSSVVNKATRVILTANDSDAQIWYTLDGSSPVTSGSKKLYASPFVINENLKIKAVAIHPNYNNSDILTLNYTVRTTPGDVNQDGEANIADINAIIDVVLDGSDDEMEYLLCDVNNDGEVNIADINTDLDVILNPEKYILNLETFVANGVPFNVIYVEGGTFTMGCDDVNSDTDTSPAHEVTVSSFKMGETEVTQELWEAVMGYNPSEYSKENGYYNAPNYPVENVSWNECQEFIKKLNELTGRSFRLPTEAEWEFAARGGNKSEGGTGVTGGGWYFDYDWYEHFPELWDQAYHPAVVGQYHNELGLCDMAGNVAEWCHDWYGLYTGQKYINPIGPLSGEKRIIRGTTFNTFSDKWIEYEAVLRGAWQPDYKSRDTGLRLVLSDVEIYTINDVSFAMIPVNGGTFSMGATPEQANYASEEEYPLHQVTLSSYKIMQTEVTQALWNAVLGSNANPSYFKGDESLPVEHVGSSGSGLLIVGPHLFYGFILELNELTGKTFRYPTEAEWEFAARGGNESKGYVYAGSNDPDDVAWTENNSAGSNTHPVATLAPNELGLYDMSGNVAEYCLDRYEAYSESPVINPFSDFGVGELSIARGGSWESHVSLCRVSSRAEVFNYIGDGTLGFRLVLSSVNNVNNDNW